MRIATVAPVGYEFDGSFIYVGGHDVTRTRKYKNVQAGHNQVALVVDDYASRLSLWSPPHHQTNLAVSPPFRPAGQQFLHDAL